MKLTVKDLIDYLKEQNPEAKICFWDSKLMDYRQMEDYLFKKVSHAKEDNIENLKEIFSELPKNDIDSHIKEEMKNIFKFVNDDDILIGLKN